MLCHQPFHELMKQPSDMNLMTYTDNLYQKALLENSRLLQVPKWDLYPFAQTSKPILQRVSYSYYWSYPSMMRGAGLQPVQKLLMKQGISGYGPCDQCWNSLPHYEFLVGGVQNYVRPHGKSMGVVFQHFQQDWIPGLVWPQWCDKHHSGLLFPYLG